MKKLLVMVSVATLLCAGNALAQLDPDDDGIGIYADPCGCANCVPLAEGQHTLYLVITHPTSPEGVLGWECEVSWDGPGIPFDWQYEGLALNVYDPPVFAVGLAEPIINAYWYPAVPVAIFQVIITSTDEPFNFYIDGIQFHSLPERVPAYLDGADISHIIELQQVTGGPDFPVATFNGDCAIDTEDVTWSGVKDMFR